MALGDRASPEPARRYSSSSTRRRRLPSPQTTPPARVLGQRAARTLPFPCIKRFPHKPRPRGREGAPRGPGCRLHRRRAAAAAPRVDAAGPLRPAAVSWRGDAAAGCLFGAATGNFSWLPRRLFPELMTNKNGHLCVDASGPSPCAAGVRVVDMRLIPWMREVLGSAWSSKGDGGAKTRQATSAVHYQQPSSLEATANDVVCNRRARAPAKRPPAASAASCDNFHLVG